MSAKSRTIKLLTMVVAVGAIAFDSELSAQGSSCSKNQQCLTLEIESQMSRYSELYARYGQHEYVRRADARSSRDQLLEIQAARPCLNCAVDGVNFVKIKAYGVDERQSPEALLNREEEIKFSATQRIECAYSNGDLWITTGTIAGDYKHGVGVSHSFYDKKDKIEFAPQACKFRVYSRGGKLLEEVDIVKYRTRWKDKRSYGESNDDLMMFELGKEPEYVYRAAVFETNAALPGTEVLLVGFHSDVPNPTVKRKNRGRIFRKKGTQDDKQSNIFVTDADAYMNTSGSPLYSPTGRVVGLMRGIPATAAERKDTTFDPIVNYNQGIAFDERFLSEFEAFLKSKP